MASKSEKPCSPYLLRPLRSLEQARKERVAQHLDAAAAQKASSAPQAEGQSWQTVIDRHAEKGRNTWRATS